MSETQNTPYDKTVRELHGKVEMAFYETSGDDDTDVSLDSRDLENDAVLSVTRKQLVTAELKPAHKYATLDGHHTRLGDPSWRLLDYGPDTVFPLHSKQVSGADRQFAAPPVYRLEYADVRRISRILLVGDEMWQQGPTSYRLHVYATGQAVADNPFSGSRSESVLGDYTVREPVCGDPQDVTEDGKTWKKYTFTVNAESDGADPETKHKIVKQCVDLCGSYEAMTVELEILAWSEAYATAKMMYVSDDVTIVFGDDELQSVTVLEEMTESADTLGYGLTSNYCAVKVKNRGNCFVAMPDLLKRNRVVCPFVREKDDAEWRSLGRFYSDEWDVSATSEFVTCKSYDILYRLQKIDVCYPMDWDEDLQCYVMDGTAGGGKVTNAYGVFCKLIGLIDSANKASGIFGSDIPFVIDEADRAILETTTFDYVCLGNDTAWNMLQTVANAAQCFVYVDRKNNVRIVADRFGASGTDKTPAASITPSNSFSYNLPTMSQAVVNRVTVPYCVLETENAKEDNDRFTVKPKDFAYDEFGNVILNLSLKNFYPKIKEVQLCDERFYNGIAISAQNLKISYDHIEINLEKGVEDTQNILIVPLENGRYELTTENYLQNERDSQRRHGVEEFELESGNMIFGEEQAKAIAEKIIGKYSEGLSFIETEWRGTPLLELGDTVVSYSRKNPTPTRYECLSNELTYDGGLRAKTKARKFAASG